MHDLKIKVQHFAPHLFAMHHSFGILLQICFHGGMKPAQRCHKRLNIFFHPVNFAFPFHGKQFLIAFLQPSLHPIIHSFDRPLQPQEVFLAQSRAVHLPSPLHQVMRFVNQKNIFSLHAFGKKAFQIDMRVEYIIIIADNSVGKKAHIQPHLKRADPMIPRIAFDPSLLKLSK